MITILLMAILPYAVEPPAEIKVIAHRGGVVDEQHAENTLAALNEAIKQGYWMAEIDIRQSKDGEVFVQHDANFHRVYGSWKNVSDLTAKEIRQLRSKVANQPPPTLAEFAAQCRGKIRLMVDTEIHGNPDGFLDKMEKILRENDLLATAFFIGAAEQKTYFKGKGRVAADSASIERAAAAGEPVADLYFLFEHGNVMDEPAVTRARALNVPVVASVNTLHYMVPKSESKPETDIQRLRKLGVTYFQIDSAFAKFLK